MAKKKGICRNIDGGCTLAESKVVQEVESTNYVCEECGAELYEVKGGVTKTDGDPWRKWPLVAVIAAIVLAAGAAAIFLLRDKAPETVAVTSVDLDKEVVELQASEPFELVATVLPENATDKNVVWAVEDEHIVRSDGEGKFQCLEEGETVITVTVGDVFATCHVTVLPIESGEEPEPPVREEPKKPAAGYSLGWGIYSGPMQDGKPHGLGGEVKVTKAYTLDLKKGNGEERSLDRGDKIVDCKFKDGKLVSGYIHYADGRQERINIGA